jgi:sec-independent protein translocase protein TatC
MDYPDDYDMEGLEPYMGYDEYGQSDGGTAKKSDSREDDGPSEKDTAPLEVTPPVVAGVLDIRRGDEIDVDGGGRPTSDYTGPRIGYREIPVIPHTHDPRRVSLHPAGLTIRPAGVPEMKWQLLDADGLFRATYDPLAGTGAQAGQDTASPGGTAGPVVTTVGDDAIEPEEPHDISEMPFLDHLEEFRWALLKSIIVVVAMMIASWFLSNMFYAVLIRLAAQSDITLMSTKVLEPIMIKLQMALFMGLVLSLPLVLYFTWGFVAPGLYDREKKWILPVVNVAVLLFLVGAAIAYFIFLPFILSFIKGLLPPDLIQMITIGDFIANVLRFTVLLGVIFEMPLISYILAKIGIIKHTWMSKYRKYAIVVIFVFGAIFTPPDPISQVMMAIPLVLLYEISILVARFAGRKTLI